MAADPRVVRAIRQIARKRRVSPKELLAAFETGIVESGLRNLGHGDADSKGWRQERASLYKDPMNLTASINRFFDETAAVKHKYKTAGELAAAVQRPAAQYRGRYAEARAQALELLGGQLPRGGGSPSRRGSVQVGSRSVMDEAGFEDARKKYALGRLLSKGNPNNTLIRLGILPTEAPSPSQFVTQAAAPVDPIARLRSPAAGQAGGRANIKELFWQGPGGINIKEGKKVPQGFVSGHDRHVHVAAPTEAGVLRLARVAQEMGLKVGEHPKFGGVGGGHVKGSNHYARRAIDVTGDPRKLRAFAHRVASMAR